MSDGADMGISADRALKTVIGGEDQPTDEEKATPEQVRERLMQSVPLSDIEMRIEDREEPHEPGQSFYSGPTEVLYRKSTGEELNVGYGGATDIAARAVLEFIEAHPEHADTPIENDYGPNPDWGSSPKPVRQGLYEVMKENGIPLGILGLSGFMWGFAYNTAMYVLGEPPQENPAFLDVEV